MEFEPYDAPHIDLQQSTLNSIVPVQDVEFYQPPKAVKQRNKYGNMLIFCESKHFLLSLGPNCNKHLTQTCSSSSHIYASLLQLFTWQDLPITHSKAPHLKRSTSFFAGCKTYPICLQHCQTLESSCLKTKVSSTKTNSNQKGIIASN